MSDFFTSYRNLVQFLDLLKYYIEHDDEASKIAQEGHLFALKWHREVNRVVSKLVWLSRQA